MDEYELLMEYVNRVHELKDTIKLKDKRIVNLEAIAQALTDELIEADIRRLRRRRYTPEERRILIAQAIQRRNDRCG